jgi:SAM-dependent methyltransferase
MSNWLKFKNTYLQLPWLFPLVIGDRQYDDVLAGHPRSFSQKVLERLFWFWPRVVDATAWAAGDSGKLQTPENYSELDRHGKALLECVMKACPDRDAEFLDIGCNCGRHIMFLAEQGYGNITGVDAMGAALRLFAERAPDVFAKTRIHHDLFQRFLSQQPDRSFDVVYSHGATIELVHPSFDIVAHLSRITRRCICLFLIEDGPFARDWVRQFERHGFALEYGVRPVEGTRASMLVLRRSGGDR